MGGTNDKCPASQAGQGHNPPCERGVLSRVSRVGISEAESNVRILLSERVTRHLENHGGECFLIVAKDKSDEHSGRMVLHLVPTTHKLANAAVRVARGLSKESRPKRAPAPVKTPPAASQSAKLDIDKHKS
jgi:hypothetical protein